MGLAEFNLIERYFTQQTICRGDVDLPVGDDAALVSVALGHQLAVSVDTLIAGVHFPENTAPEDIGYKALAVNLSDLAAMAAKPAWVTLALTLPQPDDVWLEAFSSGFFELAQQHHVQLIGGDTCRGPLSLSVQIMGSLPQGQGLKRSGAKAGDLIYVTGRLGDAGLGLQLVQSTIKASCSGIDRDYFIARLNRPTPRVEVGLALRGLASAAIDLSDGLAADLGHILKQSGVGAAINVFDLPMSDGLQTVMADDAWRLALNAGDDYELCFCVAKANQAAVEKALAPLDCPYAVIGSIEPQAGLRLYAKDGQCVVMDNKGYQHFD